MTTYIPVRLHVDPPLLGVQAVRLQRARLAEALDLVHHLVSAVVAGSWQALGVLAASTSSTSSAPRETKHGTAHVQGHVRFIVCTRDPASVDVERSNN